MLNIVSTPQSWAAVPAVLPDVAALHQCIWARPSPDRTRSSNRQGKNLGDGRDQMNQVVIQVIPRSDMSLCHIGATDDHKTLVVC
jgi:hypothetical protein